MTYDADYVPRAFPLNNTGAICWFNSLLQSLLSLPSLNLQVIETAEHKRNRFSRAYANIVNSALDGHDAALADSSADLLAAMRDQATAADIEIGLSSGQECADAGFVKFIELLGCPHAESLFCSVYEMRIHCTGCNKTVSTVRDKLTRVQMFAPIRAETDFNKYLLSHKSEHDFYRCDCGHKMAKFDRVEVLKMVREVIVVVFNKFGQREALPVPSALTFPRAGGGSLNYKLVAKIDHSGTLLGGHYRADVFRHDRWWSVNDTSVSAGSPQPTEGTFIAFYHMV